MFLRTLAFPWFLFATDGELIERGPGSLFELPPDADTAKQIALYKTMQKDGWHKCGAGYDVFVRRFEQDDHIIGQSGWLVLPGLKVRGGSRINEKPKSFSLFCEKYHVVNHVKEILAAREETSSRFEELTRQNIHEIRGINTGIYHAAIELEELLSSEYQKHPKALAGNINALSQILSARIDFMNFLADSTLNEASFGKVAVFQKFDKMVRSFRPRANKSKVDIRIIGESFERTYGPKKLFDLVTYLLIDNAVKYSPENEQILVTVRDLESKIFASVNSVGPRVLEGEEIRIFEQNYRGVNAEQSAQDGSGIGLYAVRRLVEDGYSGEIGVVRGNHVRDIDGVSYDRITFELTVPIDD